MKSTAVMKTSWWSLRSRPGACRRSVCIRRARRRNKEPHMKTIFIAILLARSGMAQAVPDIAFDSAANLFKMPEHIYMGEAAGVATDSKGNIYVYTRTGASNATMGGSRIFSHGGSRLFEFDSTGKFLREIGVG